MVRPFREETLRYGEYSKPGEYVYDHPFLWGSRRIGPDLQRVGGKYPDSWHYDHMMDPQSMSPGSLMPTYTHLFEQSVDFGGIDAKVPLFSGTFGAPYNKYDLEHVEVMARGQAATIAEGLMAEGRPDIRDKKIVALIAYLQRLGTDIRWKRPEAQAPYSATALPPQAPVAAPAAPAAQTPPATPSASAAPAGPAVKTQARATTADAPEAAAPRGGTR